MEVTRTQRFWYSKMMEEINSYKKFKVIGGFLSLIFDV
jgi:hypothetical protein